MSEKKTTKSSAFKSKLKIGYWNMRGLAAPLRMILHYAEQDFEDVRYQVVLGEKDPRKAWNDVKFKLGLTFPNLPFLICGDYNLTESNAILRYLAAKLGLDGATDEERAWLDCLCSRAYDYRNDIVRIAYNKDYKNLLTQWRTQRLPGRVSPLEKVLKGRKFFNGSKVSYVDFLFWELFDQTRIMYPKAFDSCPNVTAFMKNVEALPTVKKYLSSKGYSSLPINNPYAYVGNSKDWKLDC